jgi:hypothetical protein
LVDKAYWLTLVSVTLTALNEKEIKLMMKYVLEYELDRPVDK